MASERILIIDDNPAIHGDFRKVLAVEPTDDSALNEVAATLFGQSGRPSDARRHRFQVDSAYQGQEGLQMIRNAATEGRAYAMVFVDVRMPPGWDGVETTTRAWQEFPDLNVIICTAYSDYCWEAIVERLRRTDRLFILKKPFDPIEVRQLVEVLAERNRTEQEIRRHRLRLEELVEERTAELIAASKELRRSNARLQQEIAERRQAEETLRTTTREIIDTQDIAVLTLAKTAECRDEETGEHLLRIRNYSRILANQLRRQGPYREQIDETFLSDLYRSSLLHDIGKVGIPDAVLLKPGRLTPDEWEMMKQHAIIGGSILDEAVSRSGGGDFLSMAASIARHHHERFDGTGYPAGLAGTDIPLAARIVAVADVLDALTSVRPYKRAYSFSKAREIIEEGSGGHFDPAIVDALRQCWDELTAVRKQCRDSAACSVGTS
ncbi:MAG: HD domain-containing protein [Pirellulales bacterium]|nr:HD domain-containing protein [Pirellulales bacterium]